MPGKFWPAAGMLLLLVCGAVRAQGYKPIVETRSRDALRGVETVRVLAEVVPASSGRGWLTTSALEEGAAERLRGTGLRVLTGEDARRAKDLPTFFFQIMMFETNGYYSFMIDMQLRESVKLTRAPETELTAATWQHLGHGLVSKPRDPAYMLNGVLSFVDVFAGDYRAANGPRE